MTPRRSTPTDSVADEIDRATVPDLLADRFQLPGFVYDADGRLVRG